jgi:hypothetical protein
MLNDSMTEVNAAAADAAILPGRKLSPTISRDAPSRKAISFCVYPVGPWSYKSVCHIEFAYSALESQRYITLGLMRRFTGRCRSC